MTTPCSREEIWQNFNTVYWPNTLIKEGLGIDDRLFKSIKRELGAQMRTCNLPTGRLNSAQARRETEPALRRVEEKFEHVFREVDSQWKRDLT